MIPGNLYAADNSRGESGKGEREREIHSDGETRVVACSRLLCANRLSELSRFESSGDDEIFANGSGKKDKE